MAEIKIYPIFLVAIAILILTANGHVQAAQCNITSVPLNFGAYDPMSAVPLSATGSFNISCKPNKKTFNISLQLTPGNSGSYSPRSMASAGGGSLLYNIYANASHTAVFGDGSGGSVTMSQSVTRQTPWTATFYGRIPALQNVTPGLYSDLLTATILW